jgi:hypothetical protein
VQVSDIDLQIRKNRRDGEVGATLANFQIPLLFFNGRKYFSGVCESG